MFCACLFLLGVLCLTVFLFQENVISLSLVHISATAGSTVNLAQEDIEFVQEDTTSIFDINALCLGATISAETVDPFDTPYIIEDYPCNLTDGDCLSFYAAFDQFESVVLGKGYESYRGRYFEITNTELICYFYESEETQTSVLHNLTFSDFLQVAVFNNNGVITISLNTLEGNFSYQLANTSHHFNGAPFFMTEQSITSVSFSAYNNLIESDVWLFGDSYCGYFPIRELYYMNQMVTLPLVSAIAGQGSAGAYKDLTSLLVYDMPEVIIWCLGMNDSYDNWIEYYEQLTLLCQEKDIELILYKCPCVPGLDKSKINTIVESSGYTYIDAYKAVGSDQDGNWYEGYLSSDGVHPTELGAQALAMQFFIDAPCLMVPKEAD